MTRANLSFAIMVLSGAMLYGQTFRTPLPPNYKTTFENDDVLVIDVRYGPHEVVPIHDHPSYPTLYVYLTDSGEVDFKHEAGFLARRPPTGSGTFRVVPRTIERHSVTSLSDTESEFLRVELKQIPYSAVRQIFRREAPTPLVPGIRTEFENPAIRIERIICLAAAQCSVPAAEARSLLIAIQPAQLQTRDGKRDMKAGDVMWMPEDEAVSTLSADSQCLRVSLLYSK